jgi:hypothetical protein
MEHQFNSPLYAILANLETDIPLLQRTNYEF